LVAEVETALDPAWKTRYQEAEWVSLVRIESLNSLVNPSMSAESGAMAVQGYNYSVTVLQDWKAGSKDGDKLRVDLSDCPILLALDNDYLVFAKRNYRGQLQLKSCKHFVHATEAAAVIGFLNELNPVNRAAAAH
jgi:hypothetical protein